MPIDSNEPIFRIGINTYKIVCDSYWVGYTNNDYHWLSVSSISQHLEPDKLYLPVAVRCYVFIHISIRANACANRMIFRFAAKLQNDKYINECTSERWSCRNNVNSKKEKKNTKKKQNCCSALFHFYFHFSVRVINDSFNFWFLMSTFVRCAKIRTHFQCRCYRLDALPNDEFQYSSDWCYIEEHSRVNEDVILVLVNSFQSAEFVFFFALPYSPHCWRHLMLNLAALRKAGNKMPEKKLTTFGEQIYKWWRRTTH